MWPADQSQLTWPQYSAYGPIRGEYCGQLTNHSSPDHGGEELVGVSVDDAPADGRDVLARHGQPDYGPLVRVLILRRYCGCSVDIEDTV